MAKIIDGKAVSQFVKDEVKKEVSALGEKGISVGLAVIIVGNDPASRTYVNNKKRLVRQRELSLRNTPCPRIRQWTSCSLS